MGALPELKFVELLRHSDKVTADAMNLAETVNRLRQDMLRAYEARRALLREHFGIEQVVLAGGYGYR